MSEISIPATKPCRNCGEVLPATPEYFHRDLSRVRRGHYDGLTTVCKKCRKSYAENCELCGKHIRTSPRIRRLRFCSTACRVLSRLGGIGAKHGKLTLVEYAQQKGEGKESKSLVRCLCECGNYCIIEAANVLSGGTRSCGCLRKAYTDSMHGEGHPGWKGGRTFDTNGYVRLWMPQHPNAYSDKTVLEHIYVMSEFLGRPLRKGENVHHRNGVKADNRIENLELWVKSQPAGQRVEDMVEWAKSYIKQYGEEAKKLQRLHEPTDERQLRLVP